MKKNRLKIAAVAVAAAAIVATGLTACGNKEKKEAESAENEAEMTLLEEAAMAEQQNDSLETAEFLQLAKREASDVKTTDSGLKYVVVNEGTGKSPKATDEVVVHYTGMLLDGTKFDSSVDRGEPATFPLNRVIPGWTEGLQLMKEGGKYIFYIPSNLAYGPQGVPGTIPPDSPLVFEVELIKVN